MQGTGTQSNPYIVDNWADFVTAAGTSGAYVEFPEGGGTIDMNDVAPTGIASTITTRARSIKGNGWVIRNLYCENKSVFDLRESSLNIEELDFLNLYIYSNVSDTWLFNPFAQWRYFCNLNKCKLSGIITCTNGGGVFRTNGQYAGGTAAECSFNLKLNGGAILINSTDTSSWLKYCTIKLNGLTGSAIKCNMSSCYLEGKMARSSLTLYGGSNSNVINADFSDANSFECSAPSNTVNLINTDLLPDDAVIGTGFAGVTTAQLKDAAYLASLGFPIGVD